MLRQRKLQDRLVALAAAPILIVAVVAIGLLLFVESSGATAYGVFALIGAVASGAVALLIGKSLLSSIADLNSAVQGLAEDHGRLATGEITADELQQLPITTQDQLGDLAASINAINATTVEARETQRAMVKESLSDIVTNLARRSQTLLDRQVEYLDDLESSEEDPDRLGELFKVDHLATRMRRNAESLKVLADADPGRRRGGPVDVADVLRVAMGEVENYEHIELTEVDEGQAEAGAAMDLAHMVAELMENATQFSPPESTVEVSGQFDSAGRFVISISDQGMGMPDEKFAESNAILADPPELGLSMSRSLGFMVIGRLAQRVGATVSLKPNADGGTVAVVTVPAIVFKNRVPSGEVPAKSDRSVSPPAAPAGSPALEKLLGLGPEKLDGANGTSTDQTPATEWTVESLPDRSSDGTSAAEAIEETVKATVEPKADKPKPSRRRSKAKKQATPASKPTELEARKPKAPDPEPNKPEAPVSASSEPISPVPSTPEPDAPETKGPEPETSKPENSRISKRKTSTRRASKPQTPKPKTPKPKTPVSEASESEVWTPPEVTADAPARAFSDAPEQLTDAIPSGEAFDSGVESLLDEKRSGESVRGLAKRQKGASHVPVAQGRPVTASNRNPEEIRSMLSRYRDGLKDGKRTTEDTDTGDDGSASDAKTDQKPSNASKDK